MGILTGAGRVGRLHYFGVSVAVTLVFWLGMYASIDVDELTGEVQVSPLLIVVSLASVWFSATNVLRRLHDCGHSGWMLLVSLIPIIGPLLWIYLLFAPGDPVRNMYGPPPGSAATPYTREAHRQRMELLTAAAEQAYRARATGSLLNEDGTYNMDWMAADQAGPGATEGESAGDVPAWSTDARLATLPPPPVTAERHTGPASPVVEPPVLDFPPPTMPDESFGPPPVETELSTVRPPTDTELPNLAPPSWGSANDDGHGPARS